MNDSTLSHHLYPRFIVPSLLSHVKNLIIIAAEAKCHKSIFPVSCCRDFSPFTPTPFGSRMRVKQQMLKVVYKKLSARSYTFQ
jgi:hypothetical protein